MGGFNLGDIYGSIKLDNNEYMKALEESGAASALLSIKLSDIQGSAKRLSDELVKAGFNLKEVQSYLRSLTSQGLESAAAVNTLTASLDRMQMAVVKFHREQQASNPLNTAIERERQNILALINRSKIEATLDSDSARRQKEIFDRDISAMREAERVAAETAAKRVVTEQGASARRKGILDAELAHAEEVYAAEVAAAEAAAQAKVAAERKAAAERAATNRALTQSAYLVGGYAGGHASALTMFSPQVAVGVGGLLGLGYAVKEAAEFDKAVSHATSAMRGMSDEMKERLSVAALNLSNSLPIAAEKIAHGFNAMVENGYDAQQTLAKMPLFVKFATATLSDLDQSIEHLTSVQKAFQDNSSDRSAVMSMEEIADIVARLKELGGASALDYAKSLAAVGPEAAKLGMNVRDAGAAVRILALQNVDGARAGEVLARVLVVLTSAQEKHAAAWKDLGVSVYDADNKLKPMSQIMDELSKVIGTSDPKLNAFNTNLLGLSTRADKFVAALLKQSVGLRETNVEMEKVDGTVQRLLSRRVDNMSDQWTVAFNNLKNAAIDLGRGLEGPTTNILKFTNAYFALLKAQFAEKDVPKVSFDENGKIKFTYGDEQKAQAAANSPSGRVVTPGKADAFVARFTDSLPILRKELSETDKAMRSFFDMLSDPKTADSVRDKLEPQYEELVRKRAEIQGRIDAINQKGVDLRYRTNAALLDNEQRHAAAMAELKLKSMGEIDRLDEASLREKQRRRVEQVNEELRVTLEAIDKKAALEKGKAGGRVDAELAGDRQQAIDQTRIKVQELDNTFNKEREEAAEKLRRFADGIRDLRAQYANDLRQFTDADKAVIENLFQYVESSIVAGAGENEIRKRMDLFKDYYGDLKKLIDATKKIQDEFNASVAKYDQSERREAKQNPEILGFRDRLPANLAAKLPTDTEMLRAQQIDEAMKSLGIQSQRALDLTVSKTKIAVAELIELGASAVDVKEAMKKLREAEEAAHRQSLTRWKAVIGDISRDFRHLASDFGNGLFDLMWPKSTSTKDPLGPLVDAFRGAFEKLSVFKDPAAALDQVVQKIKNAGTIAEANTLAIRYFGEAAGPQLARDIRSGVYSVDELKKAIEKASLSTRDFERQTDRTANTVSNLWRTLVRDITVMITKQLIIGGIAELLNWMFKLKTDTHNLGEIMVMVWNKIKNAITGAKAAATVGGAGGGLPQIPVPSGGNIPGYPDIYGGGTPGVPGIPKAPAPGGSGLGGFLGSQLFGNILAAGSLVSDVIGNFQNAHQETSLNAIEHNTRYHEIIFQKYAEVDEWDRFHRILEKFDLWGRIAESGMNLLISKFDEFVIPSLQSFQIAGGAGGGDIYIENLTVTSSNVDGLTKELKRLRVTRGTR